jgi:hypothetical protein
LLFNSDQPILVFNASNKDNNCSSPNCKCAHQFRKIRDLSQIKDCMLLLNNLQWLNSRRDSALNKSLTSQIEDTSLAKACKNCMVRQGWVTSCGVPCWFIQRTKRFMEPASVMERWC